MRERNGKFLSISECRGVVRVASLLGRYRKWVMDGVVLGRGPSRRTSFTLSR